MTGPGPTPARVGGLTAEGWAVVLGTTARTVRRWFSGAIAIPAGVPTRMATHAGVGEEQIAEDLRAIASVRRCALCQSDAVTVERVARAVTDKLPGVIADGLEIWACSTCGEVSNVWPQAGPLVELTLRTVVGKPSRLTPAEFRWLRLRLFDTEDVLAIRLGVEARGIRLWEGGHEPIPDESDRHLRALVALRRELGPGVLPLEIDEVAVPVEARIVLGEDGWRVA